MQTLILALPAAATLNDDTLLRFVRAGSHAGQIGEARLADLPAADELVLLLPAQTLSWHRLDLPRVPRARMPQALAGLLEEHLLSDPAQLHMAVAPDAAPGQPTWTVVCDKAWLQQALQFLESADRPAHRVVPQLAPPVSQAVGEPPLWRVTGQPEAGWLLRSDENGVQCLPLDSEAVQWLQPAPAATWAEPAVAAWAEQLIGAPVGVCSEAEAWEQAAGSRWNLAQSDLALRHRQRWLSVPLRQWRLWWAAPAWRPLRWGLLACVLAQMLGLNAWAWQERAALKAKQRALGQLLTQHFPALPVVDPVLQMQRELSSLRRATSALAADDLEAMLAAVAQAAPNLPAPAVFRYQGQPEPTLTLQGLSLAPEAAAELNQRLASAGYRSQFADGNLRLRLSSAATAEAAP